MNAYKRLLTLSGYGAGFNTVAGTKNLIALNFNTLKARVLWLQGILDQLTQW